MNRKKLLIIISIVCVLVIIGIVVVLLVNKKPRTLIVTFDSNGGNEVKEIELSCGKQLKLPNNPSKEGFVFKNWEDKNGKAILDGALLSCEDIVLFARWEEEEIKKESFTVSFDSDGGSKVEPVVVKCNETLKLPENPTKEGFDFVSWIDKNERPIYDEALLTCEDVELKANWATKTFKVSFEPKGGSTTGSITVECGKTLTLPNNPYKKGYKFVSWVDKNERAILNDALLACEDVTLYANWEEEIKKFKVTFDSKGGTKVNNMEIECGKTLKLPANPTKEGYNFVTWEDQNETPILNEALLTCEDIVLYAKWEKEVKTFKVIFDSKGGSSVSPVTVECGKELKLPVNPAKEGYTFRVWEDKFGTPILDGALFTCDGDVTVYAVWDEE